MNRELYTWYVCITVQQVCLSLLECNRVKIYIISLTLLLLVYPSILKLVYQSETVTPYWHRQVVVGVVAHHRASCVLSTSWHRSDKLYQVCAYICYSWTQMIDWLIPSYTHWSTTYGGTSNSQTAGSEGMIACSYAQVGNFSQISPRSIRWRM